MNEERDNPEYQRGFNYGYKIAQHDPELANLLKGIQGPSHTVEGFQDGAKQYEIDKTLDQYKETGKDVTEGEKDIDDKDEVFDFFKDYSKTITDLDHFENPNDNRNKDVDVDPDLE